MMTRWSRRRPRSTPGRGSSRSTGSGLLSPVRHSDVRAVLAWFRVDGVVMEITGYRVHARANAARDANARIARRWCFGRVLLFLAARGSSTKRIFFAAHDSRGPPSLATLAQAVN